MVYSGVSKYLICQRFLWFIGVYGLWLNDLLRSEQVFNLPEVLMVNGVYG